VHNVKEGQTYWDVGCGSAVAGCYSSAFLLVATFWGPMIDVSVFRAGCFIEKHIHYDQAEV